jgi:hypothetical protein
MILKAMQTGLNNLLIWLIVSGIANYAARLVQCGCIIVLVMAMMMSAIGASVRQRRRALQPHTRHRSS